MTADLATCEWSPGSNRSTVDPVVAVARLAMPAPTRAALIAKLQAHRFDDIATITWDGVTSKSGTEQYGPDIARMNFADGRICERITRSKWDANRREDALVYIVDGKPYGVAAACGNLFELTRIDRPAPLAPLVPAYLDAPDLRTGGPLGAGPGYATAIPLAPAIAAPGGYGESWGAAAGFGYAIDYVRQDVLCDCVPVVPCPAVPEPMAAVLLISGLAAVAVWSKRA